MTAGRRYAFLPFFYDEAGARGAGRLPAAGGRVRGTGRLMDAAVAAAWTPPFAPGRPVALVRGADAARNPHFHFSTTVGRYMLLGFLPPPGPARDAAADAPAGRIAACSTTARLSAFLVLRDAASIAPGAQPAAWPALVPRRAMAGSAGSTGALGDGGEERPYWLLLDPAHRVIGALPIEATARIFAAIAALPEVADYAGVELFAPVLILPRVFEPELCRRLIAATTPTAARPPA